MKPPQGSERLVYVRHMFARIAGRYDLLNRLMTFGRDRAWRAEAIRHLQPQPGQLLLDLGSGTGDLALQLIETTPGVRVIAADLTLEMMLIGRQRQHGGRVLWVVVDAGNLPFAAEAFDGVISGYLLRNVPDVAQTLAEHRRVLRPEGRVASLDTTPPQPNLLLPFIRFYLKFIIPLLGKLVAGDSEAYTYLPETTAQFLTAEALAERFRQAGLVVEGFVRRMAGTMAIHWGHKPPPEPPQAASTTPNANNRQ